MLGTGRHSWSRPSSILVATDMADTDRLFPFALEHARETGARIVLLHVLTAVNAISVDAGGLPYYNPTEAILYIEKGLEPYRQRAHQAGLECEVLVREGSAPHQILATARHLQVGRILLGTRSRGKWGKLLLGSVAEQVLRSAEVPVLTVGPEAHQSEAGAGVIRSVLHATTLSKASGPSAALACEVARTLKARLNLLHVLPAVDAHGAMTEDLQRIVEERLSALIPEDLACSCGAATTVVFGNAAIEILALASATHASMIVLGAAKQTALAALAKDGTVYRVLAHAHCPVLTLKEQDEQNEEERQHNHDLAIHG